MCQVSNSFKFFDEPKNYRHYDFNISNYIIIYVTIEPIEEPSMPNVANEQQSNETDNEQIQSFDDYFDVEGIVDQLARDFK